MSYQPTCPDCSIRANRDGIGRLVSTTYVPCLSHELEGVTMTTTPITPNHFAGRDLKLVKHDETTSYFVPGRGLDRPLDGLEKRAAAVSIRTDAAPTRNPDALIRHQLDATFEDRMPNRKGFGSFNPSVQGTVRGVIRYVSKPEQHLTYGDDGERNVPVTYGDGSPVMRWTILLEVIGEKAARKNGRRFTRVHITGARIKRAILDALDAAGANHLAIGGILEVSAVRGENAIDYTAKYEYPLDRECNVFYDEFSELMHDEYARGHYAEVFEAMFDAAENKLDAIEAASDAEDAA